MTRLSARAEREVAECRTCEAYRRDAARTIGDLFEDDDCGSEDDVVGAASALLRFAHERKAHPEFYAWMCDWDKSYGLPG